MPASQVKITGKEILIPELDKSDPKCIEEIERRGKQTAESLLQEIKLPINAFSEQQLEKFTATLYDHAPKREELGYCEYQKNNIKQEPTKEEVFSKMSEDGFVAFCCASIKANVVKAFEMDHVFAFAEIREREEVLLACLRLPENKEFAEAFLNTQGIDKYFRKDPSDGKIKASELFFRVCYNDLGNLLPITHHINREKSNNSAEEWFEEVFPGELIKDLKTKGGIHEGIIIDKVLNKIGMPEFQIGEVTTIYKGRRKTQSVESIQVHAHQGNCQGLGDFVAKWFNDRPKIKKGAENIHMFEQKLTELLKDGMVEMKANKRTAFEKVMMFINEVLENTKKHVKKKGEGSSSSQGSEEQDKLDKEVFNKYFERHLVFMSDFTKVKMRVIELCCNGDMSLERKIKDSLYDYAREIDFFELSSKNIEQALKEFSEKLKTMRPPTKLEIIEKALFDSKNAADPEVQREAAIGEKKIAEEKAEAEAKARQIEAAARQIEAAKGKVFSVVLSSFRLLRNMQKSGKYNQETITKHEELLENVEKALADLKLNTENVQQETDLKKLQELLAEAKEQQKKAEEVYKNISNIVPTSLNAIQKEGDSLLEMVSKQGLGQHDKRQRDDGAHEEGPTKPQRPSP